MGMYSHDDFYKKLPFVEVFEDGRGGWWSGRELDAISLPYFVGQVNRFDH